MANTGRRHVACVELAKASVYEVADRQPGLEPPSQPPPLSEPPDTDPEARGPCQFQVPCRRHGAPRRRRGCQAVSLSVTLAQSACQAEPGLQSSQLVHLARVQTTSPRRAKNLNK
jgi:hypothetical protein